MEEKRTEKAVFFAAIEEMEVWQRGCRMAVEIIKLTDTLAMRRRRNLKDQLERAAISIPSNIAEGYERNTPREFVRFLHIAKGSCGELRTQLYIAKALNLIAGPDIDKMLQESRRLSSMIQSLINGVRSRSNNPDE